MLFQEYTPNVPILKEKLKNQAIKLIILCFSGFSGLLQRTLLHVICLQCSKMGNMDKPLLSLVTLCFEWRDEWNIKIGFH